MSWTTIAASDLKVRLSGPELDALQTAALADGQSDPLPGLITQVVEDIRGQLEDNDVTLEAGETIPLSLKSAAVAIVRYLLVGRLPVPELLTETRKQEYSDAMKRIEKYAKQRSTQSPSITARERTFTRDDMDGL